MDRSLRSDCCAASRLGKHGLRLAFSAAAVVALAWVTVLQSAAQTVSPRAPSGAEVQLVQPPGESAPPVTLTLQDALARAQKNSADFAGVVTDARNAHEDVVQARAERLPQINETTQFLNDEGNGKISTGRYVTQDGVHVYREWAVLHQDLSANTLLGTASRRAAAAEAVAKAKTEIARRGLIVTVTKSYDALVVAQRKYATAQQATDEARHFLEMTQAGERAGQASHSDVVKAQVQSEQQDQSFDEAKLIMENSRLDLAVLLFPTLNENFTVVDDLDSAPTLPPLGDVQTLAGKANPDLRVAMESARQADLDVTAAKDAFLPSLVVDVDYGIEANSFALRSKVTAFPEDGPVPNLGYFLTASLNIPVWDWGTLRSKLHQTEYKRDQARLELTQTQRELVSSLYADYNEALVARSGVDRLRGVAADAAESLRLINLRYQAGESPALEVVDAENTLTQARNAYADALARYRVALATLQTLTGTF